MPKFFNHIKKAFTKTSLRDEDWLEPSDRVLKNIESAIYEDDKNDRPFLFIFITALLFLIGLPLLLFFNVPNANIRSDIKNTETVLEVKPDQASSKMAEAETTTKENTFISKEDQGYCSK